MEIGDVPKLVQRRRRVSAGFSMDWHHALGLASYSL
jgi:hypothetical protein